MTNLTLQSFGDKGKMTEFQLSVCDFIFKQRDTHVSPDNFIKNAKDFIKEKGYLFAHNTYRSDIMRPEFRKPLAGYIDPKTHTITYEEDVFLHPKEKTICTVSKHRNDSMPGMDSNTVRIYHINTKTLLHYNGMTRHTNREILQFIDLRQKLNETNDRTFGTDTDRFIAGYKKWAREKNLFYKSRFS